jgi:hypothetical protein
MKLNKQEILILDDALRKQYYVKEIMKRNSTEAIEQRNLKREKEDIKSLLIKLNKEQKKIIKKNKIIIPKTTQEDRGQMTKGFM